MGLVGVTMGVKGILCLSKDLNDCLGVGSSSRLLATKLCIRMLVRAPYLHFLSSIIWELCRIICPDVFDALDDCCDTRADSSGLRHPRGHQWVATPPVTAAALLHDSSDSRQRNTL